MIHTPEPGPGGLSCGDIPAEGTDVGQVFPQYNFVATRPTDANPECRLRKRLLLGEGGERFGTGRMGRDDPVEATDHEDLIDGIRE